MNNRHRSDFIQTIVVGAGQAGLSVGYELRKRGAPFLILDAGARIGDAWRNRWDSLRLFTPARYCGLAGLPFPAPGDSFPTKDEMANYLELYAGRFQLPVRSHTRVDSLRKEGDRFVITAEDRRYEAENVVVAMSNYQTAKAPEFAQSLDPGIMQLHSSGYRNPAQLREGGVLIVGLGNSGADIGIEVARRRHTWIAGDETGHVPFPIDGALGRFVLVRLVRFVGHHVLTVSTPIGRKLRPKLLLSAAPLIRVKPRDLIAAGIERVPKVAGAKNGRPLLADGRVLDVANVIWCTGYRRGFPWIDLPIFGRDGLPRHERGVVPEVPGMYFAGLHFLYSMTSATLVGVGRDAEYVARAVVSRQSMVKASHARELSAMDGAAPSEVTL